MSGLDGDTAGTGPGRARRAPLILGSLAERLVPLEQAFSDPSDAATERDGGAVTGGLVVVESFDNHPAHQDWSASARQFEALFEGALPRLAPASNAIIVGYSTGKGEGWREELRETLGALGEHLSTLGSMQAGIDLTVNAIEVPADHWDELVVTRLVEFFRGARGVLSSGSSIPVEELDELSLKAALVNEFI